MSTDQRNEPRSAKSALTKTGGFLSAFTHTLQPYTGCRFGCEYCYVKGLSVHRFHRPELAWGDYAHPRVGIAEQLEKELTRAEKRGILDEMAVFMSSATDPYQGAERKWRLTRACLDALVRRPPGMLVVQTRSPLALEDAERLRALGERCWLSFTLETDLDDVRAAVTPRCPSVARRLAALEEACEAGLNVQAAVSPCLPYSGVGTFGALLIERAHRVVVDSFVSGDGQGGRRTAATEIPALYAAREWEAWSSERQARSLYEWLRARIGERAGWSQEGFSALARRAGLVP